MVYTKDNGEQSNRSIIVVAAPRKLYLTYDVSDLEYEELNVLLEALRKADEYRDNALADFELITGKAQNKLWRSFKPEGVEWVVEEDENTADKGYN